MWLPRRRLLSASNDALHKQPDVTVFRERAEAQGMQVAQGELIFPERRVLLAYASVEQMQRSIVTLNSIAELRRAKETAEFYDSMRPEEQREWLDDLLARTQFSSDGDQVPHVCLLDTGVNRGHPLLAPALAVTDLHTVEPGWGTDDTDGHGTEMAGLALSGNLTELLADSTLVQIDHRLESVKLLTQGRRRRNRSPTPWISDDGGRGPARNHRSVATTGLRNDHYSPRQSGSGTTVGLVGGARLAGGGC